MLPLERVAGPRHDLEAPVGEGASHALAEQGGRAVTRGYTLSRRGETSSASLDTREKP